MIKQCILAFSSVPSYRQLRFHQLAMPSRRLVIRATIWPPAAGGMLRPVPSSRLFLDRP